MFKNAGQKIKTIATICFWVLLIASLIVGIYFAAEEDELFLLIPVAGVPFAYFSALMLYGYGVIVENNEKQANAIPKTEPKAEMTPPKESADPAPVDAE